MDEILQRLAALEATQRYMANAIDEIKNTHSRHIHDIRAQNQNQEGRIRGVERYVWMGLGGLAALQVALKFIGH